MKIEDWWGCRGKLIKHYHIFCPSCGDELWSPEITDKLTKKEFLAGLKRFKWGKRKGLWFCKYCFENNKEPLPDGTPYWLLNKSPRPED